LRSADETEGTQPRHGGKHRHRMTLHPRKRTGPAGNKQWATSNGQQAMGNKQSAGPFRYDRAHEPEGAGHEHAGGRCYIGLYRLPPRAVRHPPKPRTPMPKKPQHGEAGPGARISSR
jgi:hypothetical protein